MANRALPYSPTDPAAAFTAYTSMQNRSLVYATVLCALLAACGQQAGTAIVGNHGSIQLLDGVASIRVDGQPEAQVHGDGTLSIAGQPVALSSDQRDLLKQYYVDVYKIRSEGIATGKAGMALAGKAVSEATSGNADQIKQQAGDITTHAAAICDSLDQLRNAQDAVAEQVAAFKPYATLDASKIAQCRQGIATANRSLASP